MLGIFQSLSSVKLNRNSGHHYSAANTQSSACKRSVEPLQSQTSTSHTGLCFHTARTGPVSVWGSGVKADRSVRSTFKRQVIKEQSSSQRGLAVRRAAIHFISHSSSSSFCSSSSFSFFQTQGGLNPEILR